SFPTRRSSDLCSLAARIEGGGLQPKLKSSSISRRSKRDSRSRSSSERRMRFAPCGPALRTVSAPSLFQRRSWESESELYASASAQVRQAGQRWPRDASGKFGPSGRSNSDRAMGAVRCIMLGAASETLTSIFPQTKFIRHRTSSRSATSFISAKLAERAAVLLRTDLVLGRGCATAVAGAWLTVV